MGKIDKNLVLETLNLLKGNPLVWIHDSNDFDEIDFNSRYILRVNEYLSKAVFLDLEELPNSLNDHLIENDHPLEDDISVMYLSFDDEHDDYLFFESCLLSAI